MPILDKNYLSVRIFSHRVDVLANTGSGQTYHQFESAPPKGEWKLPAGLKQWEGMHFDRVTCSVDSEYFGLIPTAVFDPAEIEKYLQLSLTSDPQLFTYLYDPLPAADMVVVYAVDKNMHRAVVSAFPSAVFRHYASICSPHFLRHAPREGSVAYAHLCPGAFYMVLRSGGKLKICNRFVYRAPEDVLYYLLFGMEQAGCDPAHSTLVLGGEVQANSDAVILLKEFFERLELDETQESATNEMKYQGAFAGQYLCV